MRLTLLTPQFVYQFDHLQHFGIVGNDALPSSGMYWLNSHYSDFIQRRLLPDYYIYVSAVVISHPAGKLKKVMKPTTEGRIMKNSTSDSCTQRQQLVAFVVISANFRSTNTQTGRAIAGCTHVSAHPLDGSCMGLHERQPQLYEVLIMAQLISTCATCSRPIVHFGLEPVPGTQWSRSSSSCCA